MQDAVLRMRRKGEAVRWDGGVRSEQPHARGDHSELGSGRSGDLTGQRKPSSRIETTGCDITAGPGTSGAPFRGKVGRGAKR